MISKQNKTKLCDNSMGYRFFIFLCSCVIIFETRTPVVGSSSSSSEKGRKEERKKDFCCC